MTFIIHRKILFSPDAYYYYAIAQNYVRGNGLTFDGISNTTGFHPLWLFFCILISNISKNLSDFHTNILILLVTLFIAGHYLLLKVAIKKGISTAVFIFSSLLIYFLNIGVFLELGVENTLLFFTVSLFIWVKYKNNYSDLKKSILISLSLLLIYFTRTDAIFLVIIYFLWLLWDCIKYKKIHIFISQLAFVGSFILLHWYLMWINFGTIFPTSALAIKEYLSISTSANLLEAFSPVESIISIRAYQIFEFFGFNYSENKYLRYVGLLTPLSLIFFIFITYKNNLESRIPLLLVGLTGLVQILFYALTMNGFMRVWYFTGWFIMTNFGLCYLYNDYFIRFLPRLNFLFKLSIVFLFLLSIFLLKNSKDNISWVTLSKESQVLQEYSGPDKVLVGWTPDRAVFFSGIGVRHLEGLVNSYDYIFTYLRGRRITQYLIDIGATHLIVSNALFLPKKVSCTVSISKDDKNSLSAYGLYEMHNSYVAIYRVVFIQDESNHNLLGSLCPE